MPIETEEAVISKVPDGTLKRLFTKVNGRVVFLNNSDQSEYDKRSSVIHLVHAIDSMAMESRYNFETFKLATWLKKYIKNKIELRNKIEFKKKKIKKKPVQEKSVSASADLQNLKHSVQSLTLD